METKVKDLKKVLLEKIAVVESFNQLPCKTYNFRCRMLSEVMEDILKYHKAASGAELNMNVKFEELVHELAANSDTPNVNRIVGAKLFGDVPSNPFTDNFYQATEAEYNLLVSYYKHLKDALDKAKNNNSYKELFEDANPSVVNVKIVDEVSKPVIESKPIEDAPLVKNSTEPEIVHPDTSSYESYVGAGSLGI